MDREEIINVFEQIVRLLELKGENPFKIRAYTNAIKALESLQGNLGKMVEARELSSVPGLGKSTAEKVSELVRTGQLEYHKALMAEFPPGILGLFELRGLGPKKIKALWDKLGVDSLEKLELACQSGEAAKLSGFGSKTAANILESIQHMKQYAGEFLLGEMVGTAEELLGYMLRHPGVTEAELAGSYRRGKETIHDLDIIAASVNAEQVSAHFRSHPLVDSVLLSGATKTSVVLKSGIQCDLRVVKPEEFPFALAYFTGSKEHNVAVRSKALELGWSLNEYRLSPVGDQSTEVPVIESEADIYGALGMDYVHPALRENTGEISAATSHSLPNLLDEDDIRGTFHNHTHASDGRASLLEMATAAKAMGFEYLGIADHSKASFQANGLSEDRLLAQIEEIKAGTWPVHLFTGVECDILKSGDLDFPDELLAKLDYVVASVHSSFSLSEREMTDRILKAIYNPHITMLGHPSGRLLLSREAYKLDIPEILRAAAETGTIIELNANPHRLDLDWRWWKMAKDLGVMCSINPDAHSTEGLLHTFLGVRLARKGWLTKEGVLNAMPLGAVKLALQAKRAKLIT